MKIENIVCIPYKNGAFKVFFKTAIDFTQNDTLGNPTRVSSFKGQSVLIDFWASWFGSDRTGQKEKWLKALHDDKLDWTQLSDLKCWNNEVAKQYCMKAIPQNLLVNPEGIFIAKNLRGEGLNQKSGEFIDGKKAFSPKP